MKAPLFFVLHKLPPARLQENSSLSSEAWPQLSCHLRLISVVPGEG